MSEKILGRKLSTNQIMKDSRKSNISRIIRPIKLIFASELQMNWVWSGMATSGQIKVFLINYFLRRFFHFILLKPVWKDNYCNIYLTSRPISISGKVLDLELSWKLSWLIRLWSIPESPKSQESVDVWNWFFVNESQINWLWSDMSRHCQINSKLHIISIFKRQIWSSFLCILNHHKQSVLWSHCCLFIYHCFSWSVQHFSLESLISFLLVF